MKTTITKNNVMKATEIYAALNEYGIVGQDDYKKALAEFGYHHLLQLDMHEKGRDISKHNICVAGPSGSAKTMGLEALSKIIGVDFYIVDGSNLTQTGYKGNTNVDTIIPNLFEACDCDTERAERAIVMIDEFDKILDKYLMSVSGVQVGTQNNFLKLFEGVECCRIPQDKNNSFKSPVIDTRRISYALTGTFGYFDVQENNVHRIGFIQDQGDEYSLTPDYLINFGFSPELVGRISQLVKLNVLTTKDYLEILDSPKGYLEEQKRLFSYENVDLKVTDSARQLIASCSAKSKIGARNIKQMLMTALNFVVLEIQSDGTITDVLLDEENGTLVRKLKSDKEKLHIKNSEKKAVKKNVLKYNTTFPEMKDMVDIITNEIQEKYMERLQELCCNPKISISDTFAGIISKNDTKKYVKYVIDTCDGKNQYFSRIDVLDFFNCLINTVRKNIDCKTSMGIIYFESIVDLSRSLGKENAHELLH